MQKTADTAFPVHGLIAERWSPRAFADTPLDREQVGSLLEAARWAPSCYNDQPWSFLLAMRSDGAAFDRLADCLVPGNAWARSAPLLLLAVARTDFARDGRPNRHAQHDVGLALGNLVLQAQALGLAAHQMAGFDVEKARTTLGVPEGHEPLTMVAVGRSGDPASLPEKLRERELAPRTRKALDSFVFGSEWGEPYTAVTRS